MSLVLVFLITYVVVLLLALIVTAVFCPRESSLSITFRDAAPVTAAVTFVVVFVTLAVFIGGIYIWGNLFYPHYCHTCEKPIGEEYYEVNEWRWHPDCFTGSVTYHSVKTPKPQPPAEQEAPSGPAVVNSSTGVENTVERISGTVGVPRLNLIRGSSYELENAC